MANAQQLLAEFHRRFNHPVGHYRPAREYVALRKRLILEESAESAAEFDKALIHGLDDTTRVALAKELADILYVTYGAAVAFGIDLERVLGLVHASNMSKLGPDGNPIYDAGGKVLKGPNYQPPNPAALAEAAGAAIEGTCVEL